MKAVKIFATLFVALLFAFSLEAKTLRVVNFSSDIPGLTSLDKSFDPDSYSVSTQIFDSLIHISLNGKRTPALATSWRLVDKTTYDFNLRKGVTFHNGEPFNAKAVKFTYDSILNPKNQAGNAWVLGTIKSVEIINPYKVRIKLKHPDGMFLFRLNMFGAIAPPEYIKKVGLDGFLKKPIGTGPFKFVSWTKGKEIVLEKNKNYWKKGVPVLNRLVFKIIPENQWVDALMKNKVDLITNVPPTAMKKVSANKKLKIMKRRVLQGYWVFLGDKGPLEKVKVRKALNYAVNKKNLIKVQGGGLGTPLASLGKIGEIGKNTKLKPYKYSPTVAKKLITEAGYPNGFSLKVLAIHQTKPMMTAIAKDLKKVKVTLNIDYVTRPEWAKQVIVGKITGNPYKGDMVVNVVDNPIINLAFHAGLFLASPSPWSIIHDPKFDKKFQFALFQASLKNHVSSLKSLDKYIHDRAMMLFTFQPVRVFAMKKNVNLPGIGINGHIDYFVFSEAK